MNEKIANREFKVLDDRIAKKKEIYDQTFFN